MSDLSIVTMRDAYGNYRAPRLDALDGQSSQTTGLYGEASRRGAVFHAHTAMTGVAPGTAVGTTAAFALANPAGSAVDLYVQFAGMAYVSGTIGVGSVDWIAHNDPSQAAITGTAIVAVNALFGGGSPVGRAYTTATVPASGKPFRTFCSLAPWLATTVLAPYVVRDDVGGSIVLTPGTALSLQATAGAGTNPLVVFSMTWTEAPALRQ